MLTDHQRAEFDAECKAVCERAKKYGKKASGEKLQDVWRALSSVSMTCYERSAKVSMAGDEEQARLVGGIGVSISYLAQILEGVLKNEPPAPVTIEELRRLLNLFQSQIATPAE